MSDEATIAEPAQAAEETIEQIGARIFADDAAPTPPAEPVVAAPEPAKVDPVAERASARIIANQRAEQRAAKVRAEIAAEKAAIEKDRAEVAEAKAKAEAFTGAKMSPSKALELLGMSPKEFLESLATEHEPEAVARRAVEGTQSEVQKIRAEFEAFKAATEAEKQTALRLARERELATEEQVEGEAFVEFIASNADKYPNLVEAMAPEEFVQEGFALLHELVEVEPGKKITRLALWMTEHDEPPTNDDIAEALEQRAAPKAKARNEWRTRLGKNAPTAPTGTPSADVRATQMDRGPSPRTLTSRAASEKAASAPTWSQEAADEESLRIIRAAFSAS